MQLRQAMQKLKFWSKKNKKKKRSNNNHNPNIYYQPPYYPLPAPALPSQPPPPPEGACPCHFYQPAKPSAPPLPAWLEEGTSSSNWVDPFPCPIHLVPEQCISVSQEIVVKTTSQLQPCTEASGPSYQHYLGLNQVCELPVGPRREKSTSRGLFGCGVGVGSFLIRCFFPCFHISEVRSK